MITQLSDPRRGDCLSPTKLTLLGNPLDFIHEDHLRERAICAMIDHIATTSSPDPADAIRARDFLRHELPLHMADEEQDLFPLLRRRCLPEDAIDKAIDRLTGEHHQSIADTRKAAAALEPLEEGAGPLSEEGREDLLRFTTHARRHLILENAIILPFARLRLTENDLDTLCRRMMQRRSLDRLMETPDAH